MNRKPVKIAIAYDFDGTLAPGNMQEHSFFPQLNIDPASFWSKANRIAEENDMDEILSYMQLMLDEARKHDVPVRKSDFENYGKQIRFFPGVETWFDRINAYGESKKLLIEHYVISSGLREFISGTGIARHFKVIFASGFRYDVNGVARWPALAVNYTNKTQFLFRINKGILNSYDNSLINKYIPEEEKPVPFSNMIYIGDGITDVPAMKMIKYQGGKAVAVYDPKIKATEQKPSPKQICQELISQRRADYLAPADYREGGHLESVIKLLVDQIYINWELKNFTH